MYNVLPWEPSSATQYYVLPSHLTATLPPQQLAWIILNLLPLNTSQSFSLSRSLSYRSNPWASHQMHFFIIHRDFVVCRCGESAPPSHSHSAKQQSISWPTDNGEIILRTCDTCKWVTLNLIKLYVKVKSNKTPRLLCSTWINNSPPARDSAGLHIMMPVGYRKAI